MKLIFSYGKLFVNAIVSCFNCFLQKRNIAILLFCCFGNIKTFEVKVLLQKCSEADLEKKPIAIHSLHGFIVSKHPTLSVGQSYNEKTITIDFHNQNLWVHGQEVKTPCYVSAMLSPKHQELLKHMVTTWFESNRETLNSQSSVLTPFFNSFIDKKSIVKSDSGDSLPLYIHDIFMSFLFGLMQQLGDKESIISLQTLEQYVDCFLQSGTQELFLNRLSTQDISKKDRKLLLQDEKFRHDFFCQHVHELVHKLLQDFIIILPRNFIAQILHDEVGCLSLDGNDYLGSFAFIQEDHMVYLVNCLDIDDYLLSVVRHEGWPGWPLEMNKVLAITCRTYLVWQVLQAQKLKRLYHIENGIRHQTYKGHHKFIRLKQAVEETRDVCIGYENKPILAMFDGCCGGIIPAHVDHPDYQKYPYLLRTEKCVFCKDFKVANWKATFSHDEMVNILKKTIPDLTAIDSMIVTKKDGAGLVTDVSVSTLSSPLQIVPSTIFHITGKKMYSIFPEVISFSFDIETLPKKMPAKQKSKHHKAKKGVVQSNPQPEKQFVFSGKGYGHHIGLCQWGAMKLVRDHHWNYQRVLEFYYPGTNLIKLTYQR